MDFIWLLFDTSLLTSGFRLGRANTVFGDAFQRMITLCLSVVDDECLSDDDDDPPLKEVD